MSDALRDAGQLVASILFPSRCVACGAAHAVLCAECSHALSAHPAERGVAGVVVRSAGALDEVSRAAVRAYKERGWTTLARPLGRALAGVVPAGCTVVPVPGSRRAFRQRGFDAVRLLAERGGLRPVPLLRAVGTPLDQRTLNRDQRRENASGMFRARACEGLRVVVVDDVITTGATLAEAIRALRAGGADIHAAATVAATAFG